MFIHHAQVGDEEYALVSKAPKKKEKKKVSAPTVLQEALEQQRAPRNTAGHQRPVAPAGNKKRSPPMPRKKSPPLPFQKGKSLEGSSSSGPPPPPHSTKPAGAGNMSYAQLNFSPGAGGEFVDDDGGSSNSRVPAAGSDPLSRSGVGELGDSASSGAAAAIPHDPKTKFDYSTIMFDEAKQKDVIAAEKLKNKRGAPPPIPDKYQGGGNKAKKLRQYMSDSNTTMASSLQPSSKEQRFQGRARPISAGTSRTPATAALGGAGAGGRSHAQNGVKTANSSSSYGDYEIMDDEFFNEEEEEFENVPRKSKFADGANIDRGGGSYVTPPPLPSRQIQASNSGYENVELEINSDHHHRGQGQGRGGVVDRQNQPLPPPPPPSREQQQHSPRPQQLLTKSLQQNGGAPPQPKPRLVFTIVCA